MKKKEVFSKESRVINQDYVDININFGSRDPFRRDTEEQSTVAGLRTNGRLKRYTGEKEEEGRSDFGRGTNGVINKKMLMERSEEKMDPIR